MFTGLFDLKKTGEYPYMLLDGEAGGEAGISHGKPPPELIRHEVSYEELPEPVRRKVLKIYREMWGLQG